MADLLLKYRARRSRLGLVEDVVAMTVGLQAQSRLRHGHQAAFGARAARYLASLPPDLPVLVCDGTDAEFALAQAVAWRREARPFFVAPILDDPHGSIVRNAALACLQSQRDPDERRKSFEQLADRRFTFGNEALQVYMPCTVPVYRTLAEMSHLGDALLNRSYTEQNRMRDFLRDRRSCTAIAVAPSVDVPNLVANPRGTRIVVWAPDMDAPMLAIFAYALWDLHEPAIFVCKGELRGSRHIFVGREAAATALAEAAVIIDADMSDPSAALAFAARGWGIAAPNTSGAHEYIQGVCGFDPGSFREIFAAASRARGLRRTKATVPRIDSAALREILEFARPQAIPQQPLVSIVIPTFNRPDILRGCLEAYERQTYGNFELIVVNDGGVDVAAVVADYAHAVYYDMPQNGGVTAALNYGLTRARGEYLGIIADDDRVYPDHLERVVAALQSSNLAVAHGNVMIRLETQGADGLPATFGHLLFYQNATDPTGILWGESANHWAGYLVRRDVYEKIGFLDQSTGIASDIDTLIRIAKCCDMTHIDTVSAEQVFRDDGSNGSAKVGDALAHQVAAAYARHLPPDRPLIAKRQQINYQTTLEGNRRRCFFEPAMKLDPPIPVVEKHP